MTCLNYDGLKCNGHGQCQCGRCKCDSGWSGDACSCTNSEDACMANNVKCSNRGQCVCGKCECQSETHAFSGQFCEKCTTCANKCNELKDCVECQVYETGIHANGKNCIDKCPFETNIESEPIVQNEINGERHCIEYTAEYCKFEFAYENIENDKKVKVRAFKELSCPGSSQVTNVMFSTGFGIVFIGLATLLLWKLITTVHDRREFAKFEYERNSVNWNVVS